MALASRIPRWPRPPMPMMAIAFLPLDPVEWWEKIFLSGENTVTPAQRSGAASSLGRVAGMPKTKRASTRTCVAYPP